MRHRPAHSARSCACFGAVGCAAAKSCGSGAPAWSTEYVLHRLMSFLFNEFLWILPYMGQSVWISGAKTWTRTCRLPSTERRMLEQTPVCSSTCIASFRQHGWSQTETLEAVWKDLPRNCDAVIVRSACLTSPRCKSRSSHAFECVARRGLHAHFSHSHIGFASR